MAKTAFTVLTVALAVLLIDRMKTAEAFTEEQAVRAIIGEASNQGFKGMVCVAEGIRNRGTLKGVRGLRAKHVDKQPERIWRMARRAWKTSAKTNYVKGASHWESTDFPMPRWARKMDVVAVYKKHVFYRVSRKGKR